MERGVIAAWVGCNNAGFTLTALWLRQCESNVLERSVSFFGLLTGLRVSQCLWLLLGARSCCCDYCGASLLSPRPWAWVFCPLSFTAGSPLHASLSGSHDIPSLAWPGIVFVVYFVISVPGGGSSSWGERFMTCRPRLSLYVTIRKAGTAHFHIAYSILWMLNKTI